MTNAPLRSRTESINILPTRPESLEERRSRRRHRSVKKQSGMRIFISFSLLWLVFVVVLPVCSSFGYLDSPRGKLFRQPTVAAATTMDDDVERIRSIGGPRADVYGEMTSVGLLTMGHSIGMAATDRFLDLGSGDGGLVLQAPVDFGVALSMGIELSQERHAKAIAAARDSPDVTFVMGDAAGPAAVDLLHQATVVYCSNLLFAAPLQERLAHHIATHGSDVRVVVSLKEFPSGIAGFHLQTDRLAVEMSWTAGKHQQGHPPLPGHPCCVYTRL